MGAAQSGHRQTYATAEAMLWHTRVFVTILQLWIDNAEPLTEMSEISVSSQFFLFHAGYICASFLIYPLEISMPSFNAQIG